MGSKTIYGTVISRSMRVTNVMYVVRSASGNFTVYARHSDKDLNVGQSYAIDCRGTAAGLQILSARDASEVI